MGLTLNQFNDQAEGLQDIALRLFSIPKLVSNCLVRPLPPDFRVLRAIQFTPDEFTTSFLSPEELAQLNGFKVMKKQVEWICGRFAVKSLVQESGLQSSPLDQIHIQYHPFGAPFLAELPDLCLSLSHSGEYTAAALSLHPGITLGIDIERIGDLPEKSFMKTAFTPREIQAMGKGAGDIFTCWTLKEAYLKYIGKGFNESLHSVEILGNSIFHNGDEIPVQTRSWRLEKEYSLSLVRA